MKKKFVSAFLLFISQLFISSFALASAAAEGGGADVSGSTSAIAITAGICIAIAAAFGALGQSKALSSALEGIARNPGAAGKVMTPMIIGLAMIESLVIYALVISLMLVLKL